MPATAMKHIIKINDSKKIHIKHLVINIKENLLKDTEPEKELFMT